MRVRREKLRTFYQYNPRHSRKTLPMRSLLELYSSVRAVGPFFLGAAGILREDKCAISEESTETNLSSLLSPKAEVRSLIKVAKAVAVSAHR